MTPLCNPCERTRAIAIVSMASFAKTDLSGESAIKLLVIVALTIRVHDVFGPWLLACPSQTAGELVANPE